MSATLKIIFRNKFRYQELSIHIVPRNEQAFGNPGTAEGLIVTYALASAWGRDAKLAE
jgi:hypothetical protein